MPDANGGNPVNPDYSPEAVLARIRERRDEGNPTVRIPGWLLVAVLAVIGVAVWHWYRGLGVADIPLCAVNTSSDTAMDIYLDGKFLGTARRMLAEDPGLAVMGVLKVGNHELEARDGSGAVIAGEKLAVEKDSNGFLWTPAPDSSAMFLIQTSDYGESTGNAGEFPLEANVSLQPLTDWVTHWFRDNPKSVSAPRGWKRTHEHALRFTRSRQGQVDVRPD